MATLAILGPTASGKSTLALDVARARQEAGLATEIVAIDAFTVYRGMDLATAKPTTADRARVPHHMIDILAPSQDLTVAWFQRRARQVIDGVRARGSTPLLVGGSGLYWRAVVDDLRFPPTDPELRDRLTARWEATPQAAHRALASRDPLAAGRIDPANIRRTIRALEVHELTGERFSTFSDAWANYRSIYGDLTVAYLAPPTSVLRATIDRRAQQMVAGGLLEEAARLLAHADGLSRTARQAIGYAEAFEVLQGDADPEGLASSIAARTWSYARRQRSWFRRDPRCTTLPESDLPRRLIEA